jgi:hypothetical protein
MTANSKVRSTVARCLSFSMATAVLALTWGCGGAIPSQATPDDGANARVKTAQAANINYMEKKEAMQAATKKRR